MEKKIYRQRYLVSWIVIISLIVGGYVGILYNTNTVLAVFGMGKLKLSTFDEIVEYVQEEYLEYAVLQKSQNILEEDFFQFESIDGFSRIGVTARDNQVVRINGSFDLEQISLLGITQVKKKIDRVLNPLFKKGYVLAVEIAVIKNMLRQIQISEDYNLDLEMDNKLINIQKARDSSSFNFTLITTKSD